MKGYRVSEARARFGELLDEAEAGDVVFIHRHGMTFTLRAEDSPSKGAKPVNTIKWAHPAIETGQWTWEYGAKGLVFKDLRPGVVRARKPKRTRTR